MNEDLISNHFIDSINKTLIKRNIRLISVLFILTTIYALFNLLDWYIVLSKAEFTRITPRIIFLYRIHPIISVVISVISIIGYFLILNGNRSIAMSFEKNEADLFNRGYQLFYRAGVLSVVSFGIAIISIMIRIIFKL